MENTPNVLKGEYRVDSVKVDTHSSREGFFYDEPILTRTGIFDYKNPDGSIRRELRLPEQVFDPESLSSYQGKPVVITHDAGEINKDNVRWEQVGNILTEGYRDGDTVRAKIVINDIDSVKSSGLRELSLGYFNDLIEKPGEWNGQHYDAIQTNIRVNHLAVVAVARAGDAARLNLDSKDQKGVLEMDENNVNPAVQTNDEAAPAAAPASPIDPAAFAAAMEAYLKAVGTAAPAAATADSAVEQQNPDVNTNDPPAPDAVQTDADGAETEVQPESEPDASDLDVISQITQRRDAMEDGPAKEDINTLLSMLEKSAARADALEAAQEQKPTADGCTKSKPAMNTDSADVQELVRERVELIRLGDRLNLDGMDSMPVKAAKAAIVNKVIPGMNLKGRGDAYLDAAYDIAKSKATARRTINDQRAQVFNADSANSAVGGAGISPNDARAKMIAKYKQEKED